jgi:hypothetical protein
VIDGRLTLLEAAARFRDLNLEPPLFCWGGFRACYPSASDDGCHCLEVIGYVRAEQRERPGTAAGIADRLEAELQEHVRRGDLRLPVPGAAGGRETGRR